MAITREKPYKIHLGGHYNLLNQAGVDIALEAITPGHFIQRVPGGWQKHAAAEALAQPSFALEAPEMNKSVDDAYATDDLLWVGVGSPGSSFWAWLASGENVEKGDPLESAGDGTLREADAITKTVAFALEPVNTAAGAARIRIEVR